MVFVEQEVRIEELENAMQEIMDLARTGLPAAGMSDHEWNIHRLNRIAAMADRAKRGVW
jgi:hypothetical protein